MNPELLAPNAHRNSTVPTNYINQTTSISAAQQPLYPARGRRFLSRVPSEVLQIVQSRSILLAAAPNAATTVFLSQGHRAMWIWMVVGTTWTSLECRNASSAYDSQPILDDVPWCSMVFPWKNADFPRVALVFPWHPNPSALSHRTLHGIVFPSAGGADQLHGFRKADQIVR